MYYKKITLISLTFLLSIFFLTGCKSSENNTTESSNVNTQTEQSDAFKSSYNISELAEFDGKNGNKCLVAVSGVVYDVTESEDWEDGVHKSSNGQATCGNDLSSVINSSPHGRSVLTSPEVKKVGELK